jgi:capsular polysaccharide biosynthesis protein
LAGSVVDVVADVVTVVLVVPVVPIVAEVPEVSAVVNMSLLLVPVVADMVLVVDDTAVSVVTVSVLAFSCFLQPNANRATASRAKTVTERDFFIARSPKSNRGITAGGCERNAAHVALY